MEVDNAYSFLPLEDINYLCFCPESMEESLTCFVMKCIDWHVGQTNFLVSYRSVLDAQCVMVEESCAPLRHESPVSMIYT